MNSKTKMISAMAMAAMVLGSVEVQAQRNYFVTTNNVKEQPQQQVVAVSNGQSSEETPGLDQQKDFLSRNFRYVSMCDWTPGMRFMCVPTQKDLVVKTFAEAKTGNMISSRRLKDKVLIYDGYSNPNGSLHEHVDFHLEENPAEAYYFEVPTGTFDDYCYGKAGVPTLAYLGDVDMAIDSLVGKKVRILVRDFCQDSGTSNGGYTPVDIGDELRGTVMTITKVGVGTRNFPVKVIVKEPDKEGREGREFFQYVAISRTNCGMRDEDFERSDNLPHSFRGSFQLLDDKMAVTSELKEWVGKKVYTFFDTKMRNEKEQTVKVIRLSTFEVMDIYRLGDGNTVTLTLKGQKSGETYTKEVAVTNTKVNGSEDVLSELFIEGDPEAIEGVRAQNLQFIRQRQVKKGFTEAEVRLALGEPTDVTRITANEYQWTYAFKEDSSRPFRVVKFSYKTKRVSQDMTR